MEGKDIAFLDQLIDTLEQAQKKVEEVQESKDAVKLNKLKKLIGDVQMKISEILK